MCDSAWPPKRPTRYKDAMGALYQVTPHDGLLRRTYHVQPVDEYGLPRGMTWACRTRPDGFAVVEAPDADAATGECKHRWLQLVQPATPDLPAIYECSNATCRARLWGEAQNTPNEKGRR